MSIAYTVFYLFVPPYNENDFFHGRTQLEDFFDNSKFFFEGGAQLDDFLGIFYNVIIINFQNSKIFFVKGTKR
jgi:hypothetical protein